MAEAVESGEPVLSDYERYRLLVEKSPDVRAMLDRVLEQKERAFLKENTLVLHGYNPAFYIEIDLTNGETRAYAPPVTRGQSRQYEFVLLRREEWLNVQDILAAITDQLKNHDKRLFKLSNDIGNVELDVKALKPKPGKKKDGEV